MKTIIFSTFLSACTLTVMAQEVIIDTVRNPVTDTVIMNETMKNKIESKEVKVEISDDKNRSSIIIQAQEAPDTTRFRVGKTEIIILDDRNTKTKEKFEWDNSDTIYNKSKAYKRRKPKFEGHLESIDFGINLFSSKSQTLVLPDDGKFLELNEGRSFEFGINIFQLNIPIVSKHLGIVPGIGTKWNNYIFDNTNTRLDNTKPVIGYTIDSAGNWHKSKLNIWTINVPVMLEFQTRIGGDVFWIAGGGYGSLKLASKNKLKGSEKRRFVEKKDYHINPLQYGLMARAGYSNIGIYATYSLNPLFKKDEGPEIYPLSVGVTITFN